MKRISFTIIVIIFLSIATSDSYGQSVFKDNFIKIANSYLKYLLSKFPLDTSTAVFVISTTTQEKDSIWFDITIKTTNIMTDIKYTSVYGLGNYKLVIAEDWDSSGILKNVFKRRPYINLNKGKVIKGLTSDDFNRWYFLMNKKYEIVSVYSGISQKEIIGILRKSKVRFAPNFTLIPE